jgi:hypothetical protein
MNDGTTSVFSKYVADIIPEGHSEPEIVRRGPQPLIAPAHAGASPIEQLLAWAINYWPKPVITLRDIYSYGPTCARDPAEAMNLTKKLSEYGWLTPVAAWRRDQIRWKIVREPTKAPSQL